MLTEVTVGDAVFDALASEWDALAGRSMTNTPFQKLAYQKAWWQHLQPEGAELYTAVVRNDAGELTAIACLYLTPDGTLHFNGCIEETDYLDLIAAPETAVEGWTAVLAFLHDDRAPSWQRLELCNIPAASPSRAILPELGAAYGLACQETVNEVCPIITLPDSFDAYLESLDSKQRREVQRKLRRAEGADATLHVVGPADDLQAEVDAFLELLQRSTFEKRDWLNAGRRAVFHDVATAAMADGTLQLMFMEVDGQKGATLFNFDYNGRIWVYNSGLDPQMFSALSLGVVLTAAAIEYAIEHGRGTFDFLRGNETYKYRFGAEDTLIYRLELSR